MFEGNETNDNTNGGINLSIGLDWNSTKPTTNPAANIINSNAGNNVRIVKIEELEAGEYFSGLIYVKKSNYRKSKYKEGYDLRMYCVDGSGNIFTATCFNTKDREMIVENKIVLVDKGMKVESFGGNVFYNIDKLMVYGGNDIPITAFLKEIDNKSSYIELYNKTVDELIKIQPTYANVLMEINKILNYKEVLAVSPYKQMLGSKLGSALRVMMETIHAYKNINTAVKQNDTDDVALFTLISLIYFVQPTIEAYNLFHGTAFNKESEKEDIKLVIEPFLMNIIYQSSMSKKDKSIIISILLQRELFNKGGKIEGKLPIETIFYSILGTIETVIKIEEQA